VNRLSTRPEDTKHHDGITLTDAMRLLPTPAAKDSGNTPEEHLRKKPGRETVTSLQVVVEGGLIPTGGLLPTPTSRDWKDTGDFTPHPEKSKLPHSVKVLGDPTKPRSDDGSESQGRFPDL
jgi:hypothetical protein